MKVDRHGLKRTLMVFLSIVFLLAILSLPVYADSTTSEKYVDAAGKDMGSKTCLPVAQTMDSGWYVSSGETFESRMEVTGDVNLILRDGTTLNANLGVRVPAGSSLTIWSQSIDQGMGKLKAVGGDKGDLSMDNSAIGENNLLRGGNITINGGSIWAEGSRWAQNAMMRGGSGIDGKVVTINGGDITAIGKGRFDGSGAGISGNDIFINGGTVTATGGYDGAAGIGDIYRSGTSNITIKGGTVNATGGEFGGPGIGGGASAAYTGKIEISGGKVTANGSHSGAGIGASYTYMRGTIIISGGIVEATGCDENGDSGPGIGGKTLTGTIRISGGTVTSKGGDRSAGIGAGFAGNAKEGHIEISGGTVISKGGEGAAGIGGGKESSGPYYQGGEGCDDVQIKGGTVFAQSGAGSCSAIGQGENDGHYGNITFANGMCVKADNRTDGDMDGTYEREGRPYPWQDKGSGVVRMAVCQYRHTALIQKCDHPMTKGENDGFATITDETHQRSACAYCKQEFSAEPHIYDEIGKCKVCGYEKELCTVTFDAGEGTGTMGAMKVVPGREITLPECGFTAPAGKAFAGWDVNGATVGEKEPVRISRDTTVTATWAEAMPLWIGESQVTVANAGDILGDGTAKYSGDESTGTLTLDGAMISACHVFDEASGLSAGISSQMDRQLQIVVKGSSVVKADADYGIHSDGPLSISGQERLALQGREGIGCDSSIHISEADLVASGDGSGSGIRSQEDIIISDSTVKASGRDYGIRAGQVSISGGGSLVSAKAAASGSAVTAAESISVKDGLSIVIPSGGRIASKGEEAVILEKGGRTASQALISAAAAYDVWVGETLITSDNAGDVFEGGSVSYDPETSSLTFHDAKPGITGVHSGAMIQSDHNLTVIAPSGGLTLENEGAAQGINASGDLTLLGNVTINVKNQAIFAKKDLTTAGDLTARGVGSAQTTDGLIEANGNVFIEGNLNGYNKTGYGLRAGGNAEITGDVNLSVITGSVINAGESIDLAGNMDNTLFDGEARVSTNGLMAGGNIRLGGNVDLLVRNIGIRSEEGSINMLTGSWHVNNASNGTVAMDAVQIHIPDTHGIRDPEGGFVIEYTKQEESGDVPRQTISSDADGSETAKYAVIDRLSEEPAEDPAFPAVKVTPAAVSLTYGTDDEGRTLTAAASVSPESGLGTLRYYWQKQEESGFWKSVASGVDRTEYTIPEGLPAGEYSYRCIVSNSLNGMSQEVVSDVIPVSIEKAAAVITVEPRAIGLTYNGRPQRLAMSGSAIGGTILYSLDGKSWASSVPAGTAAGTYTLYYKVQADENHTDLDTEQIKTSIAKRKLVITAEPKQKTCGEADPELTYLVEGLASGDKLEGQLSREPGEDVGTYLITSRGIEPAAYCKANYTLVYQGDVLTIRPAGSSPVVKTVTVNVKTVNAKAVNAAVAKAGGSSKYVTTIILGKKVKKISKGAFKSYTKVKTLQVKTKKLKKAGVKKALKGSKITKVKVKVGSKKTNKKYVKKYKKIFTKKIAGRKVKVLIQ